ncbi:transmembrane protein 59 [Gouania willdenowi]|uniref:Transmembrane protein 59 n=1 Tax=Gouania willdenowi TaxID=441366 RepID=A0A8C5I590_GOUWI|nr:transmembrane protein 59 [Gouania willdenowi]
MGPNTSFSAVFGLAVVLVCVAASSDVFDNALGNPASCHKSCEMTYSLHTYPREEELYACQRGCRLFSICQFVRNSHDLNVTKTECESTCREAYNQSDEQYACNLGCHNQLPIAEQRNEQLEAMIPRMHLLYPLALVRGMWEDVMNQAHSFITSTITFYLQADDGTLVIFQAEPQIQIFSQSDLEREGDVSQSSLSGMNAPVYEEYHRTLIQQRDLVGDPSDEYNLFGCLSRSPWLTGWILTSTLMLSVLVLIWICCATVATAVDQYVPAQKLSIYGDRDDIKGRKLTPYPASSLIIISSKGSEEEAGPLPSKVNLGQSQI